ncbi:hypothetical protein ABC347_06095 [Sphingomonas sp. 1P06PA]|uniref:hypothetical protein n=1 Tax=Sphingomonas sp. 1P06PA TaxID=554121 RepID=UPI0039A5A1DA
MQDAKLPAQLQAFITSLEPLGVYGEYRTSLNLKLDHPAVDQPINLGFVDKDGRFYTRAVGWILPRSLADRYVRRLATLIGGEVVDGKESPIIKLNGKAPPLKALLPAHAEGWTEAIRLLIASLLQD